MYHEYKKSGLKYQDFVHFIIHVYCCGQPAVKYTGERNNAAFIRLGCTKIINDALDHKEKYVTFVYDMSQQT